ncbi:MAG: ArsR/SmtB family transcription factor [Porticoccaceae bacterium]
MTSIQINESPRVSEAQISQLADLFALLGDTTRLRIVMCCLCEPINVGGIAGRLDLSASLVSHHLRLLRAARLLRSERRGKQIFYSILDDHIQCVIEDMVAHLDEDPDSEDSG